MVTYRDIRSRLAPTFRFTDDEEYNLRLMVELSAGRQQGVGVLEVDREDGTKLMALNTPVAPLANIAPVSCLKWNLFSTVGALAVTDIEGEPYVVLTDSIPYSLVDLDRLEEVVTVFAKVADDLEAKMTDGQDWY